jgi:hypothetical protein
MIYFKKNLFFMIYSLAKTSSEQIIKVENLRPSTNYRLTIVAESRAGIGQPTGPIQFRTLDKQIPDFTIEENANKTCLNDASCLITWNIESDGGAPITRAEILYAPVTNSSSFIQIYNSFQAKDDNSLEIEEPINTPTSIDSSTTEYQLNGLKPDTNYIVIIRLYNEAGVAEQKVRIRTNKENLGKKKFDISFTD